MKCNVRKTVTSVRFMLRFMGRKYLFRAFPWQRAWRFTQKVSFFQSIAYPNAVEMLLFETELFGIPGKEDLESDKTTECQFGVVFLLWKPIKRFKKHKNGSLSENSRNTRQQKFETSKRFCKRKDLGLRVSKNLWQIFMLPITSLWLFGIPI